MSLFARLAAVAAVPLVLATAAAAQDVPAPAPTTPQNACADPNLRCPDLVTGNPSDVGVVRTRSGRRLLTSRNHLVNRGSGPMFLRGRRATKRTMTVQQRIYRKGKGFRAFPLKGARLDFWFIPGQGRYWKLRDGLRFELWTAGTATPKLVRTGEKTRFCMRDLVKAPGREGPDDRVFPACSQDPGRKFVRLGISRGWEESYPPGYFEQYVDVTGLKGCFSLRHVADPKNRVIEADEANNSSGRTIVRLPSGRPGRC